MKEAGMTTEMKRMGVILGILLGLGSMTAEAAEPVAVWEVVTTYRKHLDNDGRLTLMSDGKTSTGLPWALSGSFVDFGKEGKATPLQGGDFYKGNWVGGWVIHGRVLMNNAFIKSEVVVPVQMPKTAGETLVGSRPTIALKDSIVDLWEMVAVVPRTNQFIRLTCDFTPNNLVLDGDRKIGTYEFHGPTVIVNFIDPQFGRIAFVEKPDNVLTGKGKPVKRKFWSVRFTRVQRQAVFRTAENKDFILYNNNRINSPRYTPDFYSTFYWYYSSEKGKRRLFFRSREPKLTAGGRGVAWYDQKMILTAGSLPR
ncbi:hypothetical protein Enr17x_23650 [Gimesia fumaroli]|uniref:Uncharacterized protein n=2 Tax=Gimesia fumaroli TaxID=2527976 RepID=A0A518IB48_9PLAN|nr:hypothetical protein Enr17x_23650 [Gimesia fumaroli]